MSLSLSLSLVSELEIEQGSWIQAQNLGQLTFPSTNLKTKPTESIFYLFIILPKLKSVSLIFEVWPRNSVVSVGEAYHSA
jgi:hypothetical protein